MRSTCTGKAATGLRPESLELVVTMADGSHVHSRAVVASGMAYRRLGIPALDALTGDGVFYGAGASEARAMKGCHVFVVGGANSAGQAAVHLARYAAQVTMLVRGRSLVDSKAEYLIREVESAPNITVRRRVAVTGGAGLSRLEGLTIADLDSGEAETVDAAALFVLIGGRAAHSVPARCRAARSSRVRGDGPRPCGGRPPGSDMAEATPAHVPRIQPAGVFAVGDVRHGSVKRVASSVGEGSIAIHLVHNHLRSD